MKVILFGSIPLATKMLKHLVKHPLAELIGVVCQRTHELFVNHYYNEASVYTIACEIGLPIYSEEDLSKVHEETELDLGLSGRFHKI